MYLTMTCSRYLECLKYIFICWKYLGIWSDGLNEKYYKYYSFIYISLTLVLYNITLVVNLCYMPIKIEIWIEEITFLFNIMAITVKVIMILVWKRTILDVLRNLQSNEFQGKDDVTREILCSDLFRYNLYCKAIIGLGNFAFLFKSIIPIIESLAISSNHIQLPTSNYYFLSDEIKNNFFAPIFLYQCFGIYGMMIYDVTTDAFLNGCIFFGITQLKILNYTLRSIKKDTDVNISEESREKMCEWKLKDCLKHYIFILRYCKDIQDIMNVTMFAKYAMGSLVICVLLCGLLLPLTMESLMFMLSYLMGMILQLYVPGWLGTQITMQSQELVFAAYNSEWIPRTESFKRSIKVFMERANTPIVLVGWKLFPLSLQMFASIMKKAYSLVTLVRNFQNTEEEII